MEYKDKIKYLNWIFVLVISIFIILKITKSQGMISSGPNQFQIPSDQTHTLCTVTKQTNYCFAGDGIWESIQGAPYVRVGVVQPGALTQTPK